MARDGSSLRSSKRQAGWAIIYTARDGDAEDVQVPVFTEDAVPRLARRLRTNLVPLRDEAYLAEI